MPMPFWRRRWFAYVLLAVLILIVYAPVARFGFIDFDDWLALAENPDFSPVNWGRIGSYWLHGAYELYAPLSYTAWAVIAWAEQSWTGRVPLEPGAFHLANLAVHILASLMVMLLLLRLTRQKMAAFAGAMVFGLHPLQIEAVAWVSSFNTVFSIALTVTALWAYVHFAQAEEKKKQRSWFILSVGFLLLALFAKPMAVAAPALALILEWMILRRPLRRWIGTIGVWVALTIPFIIVGRRIQGPWQGTQTSVWLRPLVVGDSFAFYLGKLVWPVHQTIAYQRTPVHLLQSGEIWFTGIFAIAAVIAAYAIGRIGRRGTREPAWILAGLTIMFVATLPTSGIVGFAFQRYSTVADRYMYLGMVGVAIAVAGVVKMMIKSLNHRSIESSEEKTSAESRSSGAGVIVPGIAMLAVLMMGRDFVRVRDWRDTLSITANASQVSDNCALDHRVRAVALVRLGRYEEAIAQYELAIHYDKTDPETYYNYGNLMYQLGSAKALTLYQEAISIDPHRAQFHHNYAVALMRAGRVAEAGKEFRTAAELDPKSEEARDDYAKWRGMEGKVGNGSL